MAEEKTPAKLVAMTPQVAHAVLATAASRALLNEADRLKVFEANRVLRGVLGPVTVPAGNVIGQTPLTPA